MKTFRNVYNHVKWWLFVVRMALRWIPALNLGDAVTYKGRRYILAQGVCSPSWDLWDPVKKERVERIHEREFRKVRSLSNYIGSFRSGYRFYMTAWYDIWVQNGVECWMVGADIWQGKPPRIKS